MLKKIKIKLLSLRNLSFNEIAPFLIGLIIILFVIYLIFYRKTTPVEETIKSPATQLEENQQFHSDKIEYILPDLPIVDDNYVIQQETGDDDKEYLVIYIDKTNTFSRDKAYLYLKQFGIFEGDSRIKEKELIKDEVGKP